MDIGNIEDPDSVPKIVNLEESKKMKGAKNWAEMRFIERESTEGINSAFAVSSEKSLKTCSVRIPRKNRFLSWCSKLVISLRIYFYATSDKKINLLKDKITNGNLDFSRLQEMHREGKINLLEFAKASIVVLKDVIAAFKDQATEARGLMDILCEQCGIEQGSNTYVSLLSDCLIDPELANVPLIAVDIPADSLNFLDPRQDSETNPDPEFCRAVMAAKDIEEMANIYAMFFKEKKGQNSEKEKYYARQQTAYCDQFFKDTHRGLYEIEVNDKTVKLTGDLSIRGGNEDSFKETFRIILEQIKTQGELEEQDALNIMKQTLLGNRGQLGANDGAVLVMPFLGNITNLLLNLRLSSADVRMSFEGKGNEGYTLKRKKEVALIVGIQSALKNGQIIASECRFKFPGDKEVRTQLSVTSTRKESEDGTIEWSCPFRENPPQKVIFYGGCALANTQ
ncbi:MAG: hypothetical protein LBQ03_02195 [Puniceicoccales bacterium]|jgi:hypothetical protein|nr:hypothetical protein [Puniceicoccales bacterium]